MTNIPELLYHTTLIVYDGSRDTAIRARSAYVLGTHTTLEAAKTFSKTALQNLGYKPSDFVQYQTKGYLPCGPPEWAYGDGVIVYAKAPGGHEFAIGLEVTENDQKFEGTPDGHLNLPGGAYLHYVLQTKVDYDQDRCRRASCPGNDISPFKSTAIQGCFASQSEAIQAAKACLKNTGYEFAQYDERDDVGYAEDWPFGEDVLVHAVSQTGENYAVAVRTIPGAHDKHDKKKAAMNIKAERGAWLTN